MKIPKYQLVIKTNQYVGDLGRELTAYVFGYSWGAQEWVDNLRDLAEKEMGQNKIEYLYDFLYEFYDEHGETICEIENSNNLVIYFKNKINTDLLLTIKQRIYVFPKVLSKCWEFAPKDLKVLDIIFENFKEE